ncbi:MAG: bifunctional pyr operon transcriptional regulator/uracil phosphoribosyltransferase PyrR [Jatrophihabitantaceae bacterium]
MSADDDRAASDGAADDRAASDGGTGSSGTATILGTADVARVIDRIAHQIIETTAKTGFDAVLLGIPTRGVPLARRLAERIAVFAAVHVPVGALDVTLYRDDLRLRGVRPLGETVEPDGGVAGKTVILVDDVLFSGRTIRAALDALNDLGRPRAVQLAVLVDRGHRELPIRADYVGKNVPTAARQSVRVTLEEIDGADAVTVTEAGAA